MRCFCPKLSYEEFATLDLVELDLSGRTFYLSKTVMISHFPVNPEIKIERTLREIEGKGFVPVEPLFIIYEAGMFMGQIMIEIIKPPVTENNIRTFDHAGLIGKTFTGPKYLVPKALKEFDAYLMTRDIMTTDFYFWYHSCKECQKEKGNRTIILGRVR